MEMLRSHVVITNVRVEQCDDNVGKSLPDSTLFKLTEHYSLIQNIEHSNRNTNLARYDVRRA